MKRGEIIIPQTKLEKVIGRTATAKREMTELMRDLEQKATGKDIKTPGQWRHKPVAWAKQHDLG